MTLTAKVAAAGRARESEREDRLFCDDLAAVLAGPEGFSWMEQWRLPGGPAENPTIGPRTRFFDDLVVDALDEGIRQVVLVAAGMDTRAFRLALPGDATVFELDRGPVLEEKQAALDAAGASPRCRRVAVIVDLARRPPSIALTASGFETSKRSVFVAEGLSYYLSERENTLLLDDLSRLAAPCSRLGIDMVSRRALENHAVAPFLMWLESMGIPWKFGTDDPVEFLSLHGWTVTVHDFDAVARRFCRWPPPGVTEDVAERAAAASRTYFISAGNAARVGLPSSMRTGPRSRVPALRPGVSSRWRRVPRAGGTPGRPGLPPWRRTGSRSPGRPSSRSRARRN
jgi:methyltransferase (TIGR00027 family)